MSFPFRVIRKILSVRDEKRDRGISFEGIETGKAERYSPFGGTMEVVKREGGKHPVIINVHGGGFCYGTRRTYRTYSKYLASYGFAVVNFSYRLAPENKYPCPLYDLSQLILYISKNAQRLGLDTSNVFLVGDSAGAEIALQYSLIVFDQGYRTKYFPLFPQPQIEIKKIALFCGVYGGRMVHSPFFKPIKRAYLGKRANEKTPELELCARVSNALPEIFLATTEGDFLKSESVLLHESLERVGAEHIFKIYRSEGGESQVHDVQTDVKTQIAKRMNDDMTSFLLSERLGAKT